MPDTRNNIHLVCFDLGGVLIRTSASWERVLAMAGVEDAQRVASRISDGPKDPVVAAYETGRIEADEFFHQVAEKLEIDVVHVRRAASLWLAGPYDGIDVLLDRLDAQGISTACLSNTNPFHWDMMTGETHAALPLERLTYRFASHQIGLMKPAPAIYEHVRRETGVAPDRIVFYDDLEANVAGARDAGWNAVRIDPRGEPVTQILTDLVARGALD
jgi:putative hydrolase of the HAD superfamily